MCALAAVRSCSHRSPRQVTKMRGLLALKGPCLAVGACKHFLVHYLIIFVRRRAYEAAIEKSTGRLTRCCRSGKRMNA